MFKKTIISTIIASILGLSGCTGLSIPQDTDLREKELLQPAIDKFESSEPAWINPWKFSNNCDVSCKSM